MVDRPDEFCWVIFYINSNGQTHDVAESSIGDLMVGEPSDRDL